MMCQRRRFKKKKKKKKLLLLILVLEAGVRERIVIVEIVKIAGLVSLKFVTLVFVLLLQIGQPFQATSQSGTRTCATSSAATSSRYRNCSRWGNQAKKANVKRMGF